MIETHGELTRGGRVGIFVDSSPLSIGRDQNLAVVILSDNGAKCAWIGFAELIVIRIVDLVGGDKEYVGSGGALGHRQLYDVIKEAEASAELPAPISQNVPGAADARRDLVAEGEGE